MWYQQPIVYVPLVFIFGFFLLTPKRIWAFLKWLKGSRETLYFDKAVQQMFRTRAKLRTSADRRDYSANAYAIIRSVVELGRGWFRRRTAIYGEAAMSWRIVRTTWDSTLNESRLHLADLEGLRPDDAIELINSHQSLLGMMAKISFLKGQVQDRDKRLSEKDELLKETDRRLRNLRLQLGGIHNRMTHPSDRRRFKGPDSKEILKALEEAVKGNEPLTPPPIGC